MSYVDPLKVMRNPATLQAYPLTLSEDGRELTYTYEDDSPPPIKSLLEALNAEGVGISDLRTEQSSLEDIFVSLIGKSA